VTPLPSSQVLERGAVEEALLHAAERALQRQRRGGAPRPARVVPGAHVRQPAARRQAEPDAGEAEGLPVLVLRRAGRSIVPRWPRVVTVEARPAGLPPRVPESRAPLVPFCDPRVLYLRLVWTEQSVTSH
jgi:hypothetical protein